MPKAKKRSTTYKRKAGPGRGHKTAVIPGTGEKFERSYVGEDPRKVIIPDKGPDFEKVAGDPNDEASKHQFPPPKKHPIFRKMWMSFIDRIIDRENFHISHLNNLEILCDLYVDYDDMRTFLRVNGRTYKVQGRQGEIWKVFPEVELLNRAQIHINNYTRLLGLLLKKDKSSESGGDADNWD